jgi:hypothetical protein
MIDPGRAAKRIRPPRISGSGIADRRAKQLGYFRQIESFRVREIRNRQVLLAKRIDVEVKKNRRRFRNRLQYLLRRSTDTQTSQGVQRHRIHGTERRPARTAKRRSIRLP